MLNQNLNAKKQLFFLTPQFGRGTGGLGVSAERIVTHLANAYDVTVFHAQSHFPVGISTEKTGHCGNVTQVQLYQSAKDRQSLQFVSDVMISMAQDRRPIGICCFYGDALAKTGMITAKWLGISSFLFLRGNDLDLDIFSDEFSSNIWMLGQADRVFCVSRELENKALALVPNAKTVFVANSVKAEDFPFFENHKSSKEKTLGLFGDIKTKKGLSILFDELDFSKYNLKIVGHLREESMKILHGMFMTNPDLNEKIVHRPFINTVQEIRHEYYHCDVVVIPSLHEGMPNVMLEAMSCGKIVVASNLAGMKDVIVHGENGFLFNPYQEGDLQKIIDEVFSLTLEQVQIISLKAHQTMINDYSLRTERKRYVKELGAYFARPSKAVRKSILSFDYNHAKTEDLLNSDQSLPRDL